MHVSIIFYASLILQSAVCIAVVSNKLTHYFVSDMYNGESG